MIMMQHFPIEHCWIQESFDGLKTGAIDGQGSYFELGGWSGVPADGGSCNVTGRDGAGKMLRIVSASNTTSKAALTTTTAIGFSAGGVAHFEMRIDTLGTGYYGRAFGIYDSSNANVLNIYFRYNTTNQMAFWSGASATKLMDISLNTWYAVDLYWRQGNCVVFVDGAYKGKGTTADVTNIWNTIQLDCTSPAGGSTVAFDVDDFFVYSAMPLGVV